MIWVVTELLGLLVCLVALGLVLPRQGAKTTTWPALVLLLGATAALHISEAFEWLGYTDVAHAGEVLAALIPATWLLLLFGLRSDQFHQEMSVAQDCVQRSNHNELVGLLAGSVAHDLRNMLHVMGLQADLLECAQDDPAALQEARDGIDEAVGISSKLVEDLTALTRKAESHRELVDLGALVRKSEHLLRTSLRSKCLFRVTVPAAPLWVSAEAIRLQQVLLNLVVNARDASNGGDTVRVEAESRDGWVRLAVADEGAGIPDAVRARIFDPMFTTKGEGEGTGLGLSIVQRIVHDHGGSIEVSGRRPRGTRFEVRLPAVVVAPHEARTSRRPFARRASRDSLQAHLNTGRP